MTASPCAPVAPTTRIILREDIVPGDSDTEDDLWLPVARPRRIYTISTMR